MPRSFTTLGNCTFPHGLRLRFTHCVDTFSNLFDCYSFFSRNSHWIHLIW